MTPDGRWAVSGSEDTLRVWDLETGACLHTLQGQSGAIVSVSVTPDGQRAMSETFYRVVQVWDLKRGHCLFTLEGSNDIDMTAAKISPDGRFAVMVSRMVVNGPSGFSGWGPMGWLDVWEVDSGRHLQALKGHTEAVTTVSLTPDGRWVVSGSEDNTLRVWDLESGACQCVFISDAPAHSLVTTTGGVAAWGTSEKEFLSIEMRNVGLCANSFPLIAVVTNDEAYEVLLRCGLDHSRREKGPDDEETLAHLKALSVHLERMGKTYEARSFRGELRGT